MTNQTRSTERFSGREQEYEKNRPGYPDALGAFLQNTFGIGQKTCVADIGAGTGIFSKFLTGLGAEVIAVEPNPDMRRVALQLHSGSRQLRVIDGSAEATHLPDHSVDGITVAQAFHWFDPAPTRLEFSRIARPGGFVAIVWNIRDNTDPFMSGLEDMIGRYSIGYSQVGLDRTSRVQKLSAFFQETPWQETAFDQVVNFDLKRLLGFIDSASYMPKSTDDSYKALHTDLTALFGRFQRDGIVRARFRTELFYGRI